MPSLDFYAVGSDIDDVLACVFVRLKCRIFESGSSVDEPIREFTHADDLAECLAVRNCNIDGYSPRFAIIVSSAEASFNVRRHALSANRQRYRFQETIEGWGIIWLCLGGISSRGVAASRISYNSEKGARKLERLYSTDQVAGDVTAVNSWNWVEINKVAASLSRHIRDKLAVARMGSRPILVAADAALASGRDPTDRLGQTAIAAYRAGRRAWLPGKEA